MPNIRYLFVSQFKEKSKRIFMKLHIKGISCISAEISYILSNKSFFVCMSKTDKLY